MRKTVFLLICVWLFISALTAQNTLSLVQNPVSDDPGLARGAVDPSKYDIANGVYLKLVAARGDYRYPAPFFVMSKATADGAKMDYDDLTITLEERAYDVCASFGAQRESALAIILGHELIHYYEKHGWRKGFVIDYQQLDIGSRLDTLHDDIVHETQADYLGGFLAYSAGYPMFDRQPDLIKGMYDAYKLPEKLPKYPSLQDRQALARHTQQKLSLLVDVFDTANWLTALGRFLEARKCYQYILNEYQSRETYNNVGVSMLREVLDEDRSKWLYPVELDLYSRVSKGRLDVDDRRGKLLRSAILQFDAAISLDPDYAPAYLNKACAFALLRDYTRANFYAETEALQKSKNPTWTKTASDVQVLLGIIAAEKGDTTASRRIFEQESLKKNPIATRNLKVLLRQTDPAAGLIPLSSLKSENIDGVSLASFAVDPSFDEKLTQKLDNRTQLLQYQVPDKNSKVLICRYDSEDATSLTFFHATGAGYTGKTAQGIGIGDSREALEAAHKAPKERLQTPQGEIWVYKKLLFMLDASGKVTKWVHYMDK